MITYLDPIDPAPAEDLHNAAAHPMRVITDKVVQGSWALQDKADVVALFDELAPEWNATRSGSERLDVIDDVCTRGEVGGPDARMLELGAGTGLFTPGLAKFGALVVSVDLSYEMVRQVPVEFGSPMRADGGRLPFADNTFDVVVLINMFLFPEEVDRVLAPGGQLVWVNSRGTLTPIHLPIEEVAAAMPGEWGGVASSIRSATWAVLHRR